MSLPARQLSTPSRSSRNSLASPKRERLRLRKVSKRRESQR